MARLGDICNILNGYAFKSENYVDKGIRVIRIANVQKGYIEDNTPQFYPENTDEDISKYMLYSGDLLLSLTGNVGRVAILTEAFLPAALNQRVACLRIKRQDVDKSYLYHYLNSDSFEHKCIMSSKGVAQKNMSTEWLKECDVLLPPIEKQKHVATALDTLANLIALRKQQLIKLDELVKARFVEMFGDQYVNNKHWSIVKLDSLFRISSSKRIYQNEQVQIGIPFLRISDLVQKITSGNIHAELFISVEMYNDLKAKGFVPKPNDILITSRGTLGQCYVVSEQDKFYFQDGMISWLSDMDKNVVTGYITQLFLMDGFRKQIDDVPSGTTVNYLSIERLKTLDVMLPPIELQQRFVELKDKICKYKLTIQQSLDKLKVLKKALMQEYFG